MQIPFYIKRLARRNRFRITLAKLCEIDRYLSICHQKCVNDRTGMRCHLFDQYLMVFEDLTKLKGHPKRVHANQLSRDELTPDVWAGIAAGMYPGGERRNRDTFQKAKRHYENRLRDYDREFEELLTPDLGARHPGSKNRGQIVIDLGSSAKATGDVSDARGLYGK